MTDLSREFHFYLDNQDALVEKYNGRVLAIKGNEVLGDYDSVFTAYLESIKEHEKGTFLIQRVGEGDKHYRAIFRTRGRLAR